MSWCSRCCRLRVPPPAVVLAATGTGLAAAAEIGRGNFVGAALLLQLKTVLDNADGQLARAAGFVSVFGRYLDSECDLLVDAALFVALGYVTGRWWLAAASFLALTFVLSVDFNLERLSDANGGEEREARPPAQGGAAPCSRVYDLVYAPQDRLVEWLGRNTAAQARRGTRRAPALPRRRNAASRRELRALDATGGARRLSHRPAARGPICD